jgi:type II secretory pathway pseudopilin PulG
MDTPKCRHSGLTLLEVMVSIGLAGALVLMMLLLGTTAISTDAKASDRQIASAVAESQLDLLTREVSMRDSDAREAFWRAADGPYAGLPVQPSLVSNGTEYSLTYSLQMMRSPTGAPAGGPSNRLRQVNLVVSWWSGEQGKAGYGQFTVQRTRVLRESNVRT